MKDCKLCIYWTGRPYCEKHYYIVDPAYAVNCRDYLELADELARHLKEAEKDEFHCERL